MVIRSRPDGQNDVLIVAYYFPPQNASGAQRPYRFHKYLPEFGYAPVVVCGSDKPVESAGAEKIIWLAERMAGVLRFQLRWLPSAVREAEQVIRTNPIRCVVSTFPPLATHLLGAYLQRKYKIKWIADFRDPLFNPQEVAIIRTIGGWAEPRIVKRADAIVTNTQDSLESYRALYPEAAGKMSVLWNGYDPEEPALPVSCPKRPHRLMAHVGDIYGFRNPGLLVSSISRLLAGGRLKKDGLRVQLVGPLEDLPPDCQQHIEKLEAEGVIEANRKLVPKAEANRVAAAADYLLLLDVTGRQKSIQLPAKLFDYVRIGKPILAFTTQGSPSEWVLSLSGIPHVCVYLDDAAETVDEKLTRFLQFAPVPMPHSGEFARIFDGKLQTGILSELIRSVVA